MGESAWSSAYRNFKDSGSFSRGRPRKTWSEVIREDLKERKASKDIDRQRYLDVFNKKPTNPCKHGKQMLKRIL